MAFTVPEMMDIYQRRARRYDLTSRLQTLMGFSIDRYRKLAVRTLNLKPGDTVVEVGCGTGVALQALQAAVGPQGRVIAADLSEAMLAKAAHRVRKFGWRNVQLHQADVGAWSFPEHVNGVLATFALTLIPHYADVIARGARALVPGGRFVMVDIRVPTSGPPWLLRVWARSSRAFGITPDLAERMPWMSLHTHFAHVRVRSLYFGRAYLAVGEVGDRRELEFDERTVREREDRARHHERP